MPKDLKKQMIIFCIDDRPSNSRYELFLFSVAYKVLYIYFVFLLLPPYQTWNPDCEKMLRNPLCKIISNDEIDIFSLVDCRVPFGKNRGGLCSRLYSKMCKARSTQLVMLLPGRAFVCLLCGWGRHSPPSSFSLVRSQLWTLDLVCRCGWVGNTSVW